MQTRLRVPRRVLAAVVFAAVVPLAACGGNLGNQGSEAAGGSYPERAISLLVGQDPGGSTDLIARAVAEPAAADLKQPITVLNKPGANGAVAAKELAGAKPDGYTL